MLPSVNKSSERESNPFQLPLYLYLSGSTFVFSFTDPNKQFFNIKFVFKFLNHGLSMLEVNRFITFLGIEMLLSIN